jgi:(S)-ureidoglycine aminohydrolase
LASPNSLNDHLAADLPGFTRSVYERSYAVITPESFVFAGNPLWENGTTAHLITPAVGANFAMLLVNMTAHSSGAKPPDGHERYDE